MPVVANWTVDKTIGSLPFTVKFTDTSTGSPNRWLWNFGDGYFSTDQHPTHTYRDEGVFTVTLKSWIHNTDIYPAGSFPYRQFENYSFFDKQISSGHISFDALKTTYLNSLPYTSWSTSGNPYLSMWVNRSITPLWTGDFGVFNRICKITGFNAATDVAYLFIILQPVTPQTSSDKKFLYGNNKRFSLTTGMWTGSGFDGNENTFDITRFLWDNTTVYPIYDLENYFGSEPTFRTIDKYLFLDPNIYLSDPLPYNVGISTKSGYALQMYKPHIIGSRALAGNKSTKKNTNFITVNDNVIQRPPVLYSGIKEAYFKDGWENEKHLYIQQTSAQPCIIQFIDVYADTSNE